MNSNKSVFFKCIFEIQGCKQRQPFHSISIINLFHHYSVYIYLTPREQTCQKALGNIVTINITVSLEICLGYYHVIIGLEKHECTFTKDTEFPKPLQ